MQSPILQLIDDLQNDPEAVASVSEELRRRRPGRSQYRQDFTRLALDRGLEVPLLQSVLWPRSAGGAQ